MRVAGGRWGFGLRVCVQPSGEDVIANPNNDDIRYNFSTASFTFRTGPTSAPVALGTYGDIVGTAGDYFGAESETAVLCSATATTPALQNQQYMDAFNKMWQTLDASYLANIRAIFDEEGRLPLRLLLAVLQANEELWWWWWLCCCCVVG